LRIFVPFFNANIRALASIFFGIRLNQKRSVGPFIPFPPFPITKFFFSERRLLPRSPYRFPDFGIEFTYSIPRIFSFFFFLGV